MTDRQYRALLVVFIVVAAVLGIVFGLPRFLRDVQDIKAFWGL